MSSIYEVATGDFIDLARLIAIKKPQRLSDDLRILREEKPFVVGARILLYFQLMKEPVEIWFNHIEQENADKVYEEIVKAWREYKNEP